MRHSTLPRLAALFVVLVGAPGCMLGPYDGQIVESESSLIPFFGYHLYPNERVSVLALDPNTNTWEEIGSAVSDSQTSWIAMDGTPLYYWQVFLLVPHKYWEPGLSGSVVRVSSWSGGEMMSVEADWLTCYSSSTDIIDFSVDCAAPDSPVATVYTQDYAADPTAWPMPWPPPVMY